MRLTNILRQLRFDINKHFIPCTSVKSYPMEALGFAGDKRFGYSESFRLLNDEATQYIRKLTENQDFVNKTRRATTFAPFVLRNVSHYDTFLNDMYTSKEAEEYFSNLVGAKVRWEPNTWHACHINVQESEGLDTKIFDWHLDGQPLTLIINVSDMPDKVEGGSTYLRHHITGEEIELKQPAPGYATLFRGSAVFHKASAANYKRVIYVKTMEFSDVTAIDKTCSFFGYDYSDGVDLFTQHLTIKLNRMMEQFEYIKDNPKEAEAVLKTVRELIGRAHV